MSRYDWGESQPKIERLNKEIESIQSKVISHQAYRCLGTLGAICTFTKHHVLLADLCGDEDRT